MEKHTEGLLHVGGNGTIIYDKDGLGVASATVFHGRQEPDTSKENAQRLVACWNVCQGISTNILESIRSLDHSAFEGAVAKQRDALLAALIRLRKDAYDANADSSCNEAFEIADAAIAAAKGGAV